jgi:hypothetical protein
MIARLLTVLSTVILLASPGAWAGESGCPSKDRILERLKAINLDRGSRTVKFHSPAPTDLYEQAAAEPGQAFAAKDGKTVWGVIVTQHPIEAIWKALNDEPHHAIDGDYIPVRHSEIVDGTPRGEDRVLFQYFKKAGIGRWWVTRVEMSQKLYSDSKGQIWELTWKDAQQEVDISQPPMNAVSDDMRSLDASYGAWLAVPIDDRCTLLEYYNYTEPGGFISFAQGIMAKKSVRDTVEGVVRLADEHIPAPHPDSVFIRPDGTRLD